MGIKRSLRIQSYVKIREVTEEHWAKEENRKACEHQPRHASWPGLETRGSYVQQEWAAGVKAGSHADKAWDSAATG